MITLRFSETIHASAAHLWNVLWHADTYPQWTLPFCEGSHAITDNFKEGTKVHFLGNTGEGMVSIVEQNLPNAYMGFRHIGMIKDGVEDTTSDMVKEWAGAKETYTLTPQGNDRTLLEVTMDSVEAHSSYFTGTWPKAMEAIKAIAEKQKQPA